MILFTLIVLFASLKHITSQSWNVSDGILPWEAYIQLSDVQRPLGLTLNYSSLEHHHFAIGYLCLHSFMYDEAQEAFDLAINTNPRLVEAYIGKMLGCKHALWAYTDFDCGTAVYNNISLMLTTYGVILSPFQSSLILTVYQWYANKSSVTAGERAFLTSIANLSQTYPNETDIYVLWGLSLLNVAYESDYQNQTEPDLLLQAREKLITALTNEPNHPGALHYLISAYDVAQLNISEQAINYVLTYQKLVPTLSYPQHLPAHIWVRTGSMSMAKASDAASVKVSFTLCLTKLIGRITPISSTNLTAVLSQFNTTAQISSFLLCDIGNRAYSTEWLSFSRLQTGDWLGTLSAINDLYIAYNQSFPVSNYYLQFAYRAQARAVANLFYWLPYDIQFVDKTQDLHQISESFSLVSLGDNTTDWKLAWSEAGFRMGDCLRLLTINSTYNDPTIKPIIDDHLARFAVLSNQTASLNKYISTSISMMIPQVHGIIFYKNNSFQDCLNVLNDATQSEFDLVVADNSPILTFARSSELLAMHLLLIQRVYIAETTRTDSPTVMLNGTQVSVSDFASSALTLYQIANASSPNRAINILGMARANSQLLRNSEAVRLYRLLLAQISSSNNTDPIFFEEAIDFIAQKEDLQNSSNNNKFCFSSILVVFIFFLFY